MKRSAIIFGSVVLNVLLVAVVARQAVLLRRPGGESSAGVKPAPTVVTVPETVEPAVAERARTPPLPKKGVVPSSASARPAFDWRQVESDDYRTYLANLRAIGCPEQTVRDIVGADVLQAFAGKRAEVMAARYRDFRFWKTDAEGTNTRAEVERQRAAVDDEMRGALRELLGKDFVPSATAHEWRQAELGQQLAFLAPEKRDEAEALLLRNAEIDEQIRGLADGQHTPENHDERRRVLEAYEHKRTELAALLTPEEYEQLDMTVSWTADNLRHAMEHFQPTEEEFRAIFREWRAHDEKLAQLYATGQPDPGNEQVFAKIKEFLGEERYAKYRETWWK